MSAPLPTSAEVEAAARNLAVRAQGPWNYVQLINEVRAAQHLATRRAVILDLETLWDKTAEDEFPDQFYLWLCSQLDQLGGTDVR